MVRGSSIAYCSTLSNTKSNPHRELPLNIRLCLTSQCSHLLWVIFFVIELTISFVIFFLLCVDVFVQLNRLFSNVLTTFNKWNRM